MEKRSVRNIMLTRRYHWAYLGRMICASLAVMPPLVVLSIIVVNWAAESNPAFPSEVLIPLILVIAGLVSSMMVFLGILTAHRIAGPYINLQRTCKEIAAGNLETRLRFRGEDRLEEVEEVFNTMIDRLVEQIPTSQPESPG